MLLPDSARHARSLGWLAIVAAVLGAAVLPVVARSAPGALPWGYLFVIFAGGVVLTRLPTRLLDPVPPLILTGSALAMQTGFTLATGDADSPFLPGFTAIVLATAATSTIGRTAVAVALATVGLLAIALADAVLSPADLVRTMVDAIILLAAASIVSHFAWRRRVELSRASRRIRRAQAAARLHRIASQTDPLTGAGNRRAFEAALTELTRNGKLDHVALLLADADGLKAINDHLGHGAGDRMLRALAEALTGRLRPHDRLFRIGGDEFVAILARHEADGLARRLGGTLTIDVEGVGRVSASVGVASAPPGADPSMVLRLADREMYQRKASRLGTASVDHRAREVTSPGRLNAGPARQGSHSDR